MIKELIILAKYPTTVLQIGVRMDAVADSTNSESQNAYKNKWKNSDFEAKAPQLPAMTAVADSTPVRAKMLIKPMVKH